MFFVRFFFFFQELWAISDYSIFVKILVHVPTYDKRHRNNERNKRNLSPVKIWKIFQVWTWNHEDPTTL